MEVPNHRLRTTDLISCLINLLRCPLSCVLMALPLCRHSGPESNNRRARLCSLRPHSVQTCGAYRKSGERPLFTILSISGCNSSGAESASQSSQRSARRLARLVPHLAEGWLRRGLVNRKTSALFPQKRSTVPAKSETLIFIVLS